MRAIDADAIVVHKFPSEDYDPSENDAEKAYRKGWNDALDAVAEFQPSAEPVRKPDEWCVSCSEYDHEKNCCPRFNRVIKSALKDAESDPSDVARDIATIIENEKDMRVIAQPVRKGKWIEVYDADNLISGKCSVCGWEAHLYEDDVFGMPYCPNCGARLSEGEEDD